MSSVNSSAQGPVIRAPQIALILLVALVIAGLTALDRWLEQTEEAEMQSSALRDYRNGLNLLEQRKTNQAVDALRQAQALERQNEDYTLGLIQALMAAGKINEAEPLMNQVLEDEPNDGRANLIAARLMLKRGKTRDAEAYYHRAIYGEWPDHAAQHRIAARMELIQFLETKGNQQELLAELLPLEQEARNNPQLQQNLAHLFLVAGSPSRSADLYRALLEHNPNDAAAYAGLGEADLQRGEYRAAHASFLAAYHHDSHDPRIRSRLELASTLAALDPTVRELPSMEKYRRSLRILQLGRDDLKQCLAQQPAANTGYLQKLLSSAGDALKNQTPAHVTNEMAESVLDRAEQIWQARLNACGEVTPPDDEPLDLIMLKLAQ